ncbi:hypothetical protein LR090_03905, partial [Candidatus Bipolaricaulota bacterium]|nr:hypothetical protein [Candidatus Bipolaricaulota bacterium]
ALPYREVPSRRPPTLNTYEAELVGLEEGGPSPEAAQTALLARAAAVAEAILARMERAQQRYDQETRHGLDAAAQAAWHALITSWLASPELAP